MIFAKDMKRMTTFYRDAFDLQLLTERSNDAWAELDAGGVLLAIHAIPLQIADNIQVGNPPRARSDTPIKLTFETEDLDAALARLAACGAVLLEPRRSPSFAACDGLDPEGNVFQIVGR